MKNEINNTNTGKPAMQPDEQATADNAALIRRRSLLKKGVIAVPTVMTLNNGVMAADSNCLSCMVSCDPNTNLDPMGNQCVPYADEDDADGFTTYGYDTDSIDTKVKNGKKKGRKNN